MTKQTDNRQIVAECWTCADDTHYEWQGRAYSWCGRQSNPEFKPACIRGEAAIHYHRAASHDIRPLEN